MTINAGYFYGMGMCVARAIGGNAGGLGGITHSKPDYVLNDGAIATDTTATLIINGGVFYHDANWQRNASDSWYNDAVIRAGGYTGFGTVELNGGTYIANSAVGHFVVNKYHPASTIRINGGTYMASGVQTHYFNSTGELYDTNGNMICQPDPDIIPVNRDKDLQLTYGNTVYSVYMLGVQENVSYIKVTNSAEIRISTFEMGEQDGYISGLRFTTGFSAAAIAQFKELTGAQDVSFGTLIVPKDFLADGMELTHAGLNAAGVTYLDIAAKDSLVVDAQGNVSFTAAIIEILPQNYGRDFVAVGYITAKVAAPVAPEAGSMDVPELVDAYEYTDFDEEGTSLAELAKALLDNEINAANPYSDELRALLQSFADALPEDDGTNPPNIPTIPGDDDDVIDDPFANDDDNGGDGDDSGNDDGGDDSGDGDDGDDTDGPVGE
jgi:hypothetical protein